MYTEKDIHKDKTFKVQIQSLKELIRITDIAVAAGYKPWTAHGAEYDVNCIWNVNFNGRGGAIRLYKRGDSSGGTDLLYTTTDADADNLIQSSELRLSTEEPYYEIY